MKKAEISVKEIMQTEIVSAAPDESVETVAKRMREHGIGCILVIDLKKRALGIVTERDLVNRVAAENLLPSVITVEEIMSTPVLTINSRTSLMEAVRMMKKSGVRRLVVAEEDYVSGIVTSRDILNITPNLVGLLFERAMSQGGVIDIANGAKKSVEGTCEECGDWSENLTGFEGQYLCGSCWEREET